MSDKDIQVLTMCLRSIRAGLFNELNQPFCGFQDLKFGVEQGVDIIFASFVRSADGVRTIRKVEVLALLSHITSDNVLFRCLVRRVRI